MYLRSIVLCSSVVFHDVNLQTELSWLKIITPVNWAVQLVHVTQVLIYAAHF